MFSMCNSDDIQAFEHFSYRFWMWSPLNNQYTFWIGKNMAASSTSNLPLTSLLPEPPLQDLSKPVLLHLVPGSLVVEFTSMPNPHEVRNRPHKFFAANKRYITEIVQNMLGNINFCWEVKIKSWVWKSQSARNS